MKSEPLVIFLGIVALVAIYLFMAGLTLSEKDIDTCAKACAHNGGRMLSASVQEGCRCTEASDAGATP